MKRYKTWQLVVLAKISGSFSGCLEMRVIDQAERKTIAIKGTTPQNIYFRLILLSKGNFEIALLFGGALRESSYSLIQILHLSFLRFLFSFRLINILKLFFEGLGAFGALLDSTSHLTQEVALDSCGTPLKHELTVPTLDLKVPPPAFSGSWRMVTSVHSGPFSFPIPKVALLDCSMKES